MRVIVGYDIATETEEGRRRLARVARVMKGFGVRVQKSVFECNLDAAQFEKLRFQAEANIRLSEDSVLIYVLGDCCAGRTLRLGCHGGDPFRLDQWIL